MEISKFKKADGLLKEIKELENFLKHQGWSHNLFRFKTSLESPIDRWFGYDFEQYQLSEEIRLKVKEVLEEHLQELKKELEKL